jgi:hypothetical protein
MVMTALWIALLVALAVEAFIAAMTWDWRQSLSDREHRLEQKNRECAVCLTGGDPMDFLQSDYQWCPLHKAQWQHIHDMEEIMRREDRR